MNEIIKILIDEGFIFIANDYIISLIFIYFLVDGKRTTKEVIRDSVVAIGISFIGDLISRFANFQKIIINGLNIEVIWVYLFILIYLYIGYMYRRKKDILVGILIFELVIFIHVSIVQLSLNFSIFWGRANLEGTFMVFLQSVLEWIVVPDLIIFLVVNKLKKIIEKNGMYFRRFEKNIVSISAFVYLLISVINSKLIEYIDPKNGLQYSSVLKIIVIVNILLVIMIILSISSYILIGIKNREIYLEENESKLREKTMDYIKNIREYNENISKINHDFKNHMSVISLMSEDNEKVKKYIKPLIEKNKCKDLIMTGNSLVDIILNEKVKDMKSFKIDYDIKAAVPPNINIKECDLASILFNTIDNAIEACSHVEGERKIFIEMFVNGNKLIYNIENNYKEVLNGKIRNYADKKLYRTGFGTDIVREIAYRYNGDIDVSKKEGKYTFKTFVEV